jgi:membrane protein implicated in regulation of membrane protease activity
MTRRERRREKRLRILDITAGGMILIMVRAFINTAGLPAVAPVWAVVAMFALLIALSALMLWAYRELRQGL